MASWYLMFLGTICTFGVSSIIKLENVYYITSITSVSLSHNLHSIYFMYTWSKLLIYYVMTRSVLLDKTVFSLYIFRLRHWEITSERLFNNISLGLPTISNFSCKHKLHLFQLGLYDL